MPDLHVMNIEKIYPGKNKKVAAPAFSLQSVNLSVQEGEFFALLGPSGCGKTTLLKLVAGLLTPDQGEIRLGLESITSLPAEQRGFGMVFQQPLLFPHMTVEENVAFGLKMQGVGKKERLAQARNMLEAVGLKDFGSRNPSELSGGQQQRVSLARAIVTRPKLLLMDEPFSALDPGLRDEMRELVKRIHREYAITILFVTHDRGEAFHLADRIAVMKGGKVLQVASPRDLYENPNSLEVAYFMGAKNVLEGDCHDGIFSANGFSLRLDERMDTSCGHGCLILRPEYLSVALRGGERKQEEASHWRSLDGRVTEVLFHQGLYCFRIQVGYGVLEVLEKTTEQEQPKIGDTVTVRFNIRKMLFFPRVH